MVKLKIGSVLNNAVGLLVKHPSLLILGAIAMLPGLFMGAKVDLIFWASFVIYLLVATYCIGLIIKFVAESRDRAPSWAELSQFVLSKYWALLIVYIIFFTIVFLGIVLLIIPGVFFMVRLCLSDYGLILEDDRIGSSIKRSWEITRGHGWRLFFLNVIAFLPFFILLPFEKLIPGPMYTVINYLVGSFGFVWIQAIFILVYFELRKT